MLACAATATTSGPPTGKNGKYRNTPVRVTESKRKTQFVQRKPSAAQLGFIAEDHLAAKPLGVQEMEVSSER